MSAILIRVLALAFSVFATVQTQAQGPDSDFEYQQSTVKGAISMLHGAGGNIAVLQGEEGLLIIDNGFEFNSGKLETAIATYGDTPQFVLNTHWHGDHTGGNAVLGDATIVAHENVRVRLAAGGNSGGSVIDPAPAEALPDLTYDEGMNIHFADQEISARHLPSGHTDGDSIILFEPAHVVHMGDLFFSGAFPFIDPSSGGSVSGYTANVAAAIEMLDDTSVIIPGHGPISNLDDLKLFHSMIIETATAVRALKESGKTLEEAQAEGLDAKWSGWGAGFIDMSRWILILWNGVG